MTYRSAFSGAPDQSYLRVLSRPVGTSDTDASGVADYVHPVLFDADQTYCGSLYDDQLDRHHPVR